MAQIELMIRHTTDWLRGHRTARRYEEAWMAATRLHALLDCYRAIGGDDSPWRNATKKLRDVLP